LNAHTDITAAPPMVYAAIAAVTLAMSKEGISKDRRNQQQGYNFRGIDEVYNALSPMLAQHKLCILPRMISRAQQERTTAKGGAIFYTTVEAEFDFVSAEDGSIHVVRTFGEAMDSADKSTNKAMSAAYKYAAMQTFCIPTEGDNDADATTHEIQPRQSRQETPAPDNNGEGAGDNLEPADGWGAWTLSLIDEISSVSTTAKLDVIKNDALCKRRINAVKTIDGAMYAAIGKAFTDRRAALAPSGGDNATL